MSKQHLEQALKKELEILNDQIDEKIIKGLSYARLAKRHRFILSNLANIKKDYLRSSGWLTKKFSII